MTTNFELQGGEILVNTTTSGDQQAPDMARLGTGGFVVVWQDLSGQDSAPNPSVRGQLFDADGNKTGSEFLINSITTSLQSPPTVAALQSGGFVVSWVDDVQSSEVKAQIFDTNGIKIGSEILVNTTTAGAQIDSDITALASGGFVVTWTDGSGMGGDAWPYSVKGQVFDAGGTKVGSEFLVNTTTDAGQSTPAIAGLASGGFVVTWADGSQIGTDDSGSAIKAQVFASNGSTVGNEFLVNVATYSEQNDPSITSLASGGFVITWSDLSEEGGDPSSYCVKARIFDSSGAPIGSEFLVNSSLLNMQTASDVMSLPSGGFIVTWTDSSNIGGDDDASAIKAQQFDANGQKVGVEFLVNTVTGGWQVDPSITSLTGGEIAISWVDEPRVTNDVNIKAQVFAPTSSGPQDISISSPNVSETAVENLPVATITSTGALTANFTYSILSDSTGGAFGIDGDKLIVLDNGKLDFETAPNATVTIRSTDNLGNHYDEVVALSITNAVHEVRYAAGETFQVNTNHDAGSDQLSVARLASGGSVVVWQDWGNEESASKAQLLDPQGNPVGSEFLVGGVHDPSVAGGQEGGFMVCWTASDPSENLPGTAIVWDVNHTGIMAQLFDANGQKVGEQFLVNTEDQGQQLHGSVAALEGGGYVVTWVDTDSSGLSGAGIKAQLLNAAGAKIGSEFLVNTSSSSSVFSAPRIAVAASGDFVVTWADGGDHIKAQFFDSTGARIGSEISVNPIAEEWADYPVAAPLASGGFVIAWIAPDGPGNVVKGQLLDSEGGKLGSEFLVSDELGEPFQGTPSITSLDSGGFVVTWGYLESRFAQVFDADGNKVGDSVLIGSTSFSFAPVLSALPGDGFMVAWSEAVMEGGFEIDARVFHLADNRIGTFGVDTLTGDATDNGIYGFAGNDTLNGGAGNDRLDGGAGADAMSGGADDDTYVVDNAGDVTTENDGEGTDTVETGLGTGSTLAQRQANQYQLAAYIEDLVGTGIGQGLRGNDLDNHITAGSGDDYVNASDGGADDVSTGDGRDVIYYGAALTSADKNDAGDEGGDVRGDLLVLQGEYTLTLGADALVDIEKFRVLKGENTSFGDTGGNLYDYDITTVDANVAAGARLVVQGGSLQLGEHLTFDGSAETDGSFQIFGGHDSDTLIGGAQGDHLLGRSGDDTLTGNGGADRLRGGLGGDTMDGGAGADIFVYAAQGGDEPYSVAALESTGLNYDTIVGFNFAEDKIDLPGSVSSLASVNSGALNDASFDADLASAVDASLAANGAVLFTANSGGHSGETFLVVDADGNGSYQANLDFVIHLLDWTGSVPTNPDLFI